MKRIFDLNKGDWKTIEEAAEYAPLTIDTVYRWRRKINSGEASVDDYPRTKKIGGKMCINMNSYRDWLNKGDFEIAS